MLEALTRPHVTVGRVAGVPVGLNASWFPVVGVVLWTLATAFLPGAAPGTHGAAVWAAAIAGTALFFASVLAHELGHALVARRYGIEVPSVTLFALGGVSRIAEEPRSAREELAIAAAGPAVSVAVSMVFLAASRLAGGSILLSSLTVYLLLVNGALALFNVLPALPLDGGRILRALVWAVTGDVASATRWAAWAGRATGAAFVLFGLVSLAFGAWAAAGWLALLGVFIERSAKGAVETVELAVHVPIPGEGLSYVRDPVEGDPLIDDARLRRFEARLAAWRARLEVLPRPWERAADAVDAPRPDPAAVERYAEDRSRMFSLAGEIERSLRAGEPFDGVELAFRQLRDLYLEWRTTSPRAEAASDEAAMAGRPDGLAPAPEEALGREPGSSIEV